MSNSCYFKVERRKPIHGPDMKEKSDFKKPKNNENEEEANESFDSNNSTEKKCNSELDQSENLSDGEETPNEEDNKISQSTDRIRSIGFCSVLCGLIIALYVSQISYLKNEPVSIEGLKQIFPNYPDDTFDDFETIIDEIVFERAVHPAVFLFVYNKNEEKVNKLVEHLAIYALQKLESNENYIDVPKSDFHTKQAKDDYGFLIEKYKTDIIEKKVMLVKNLHDIPGETAQIFHSFCDEISPLVERVVYIFTLKVDSLNGKPEKIAETNLKRVWSDLDNDVLMPLITRVTSTVLKISN